MIAKKNLFSAAALFSIAGTLVVLGCAYDATSSDGAARADAEYRTPEDSAHSEQTIMMPAGSEVYSRASEYEYVHDEQLGTYLDTSTPRRKDSVASVDKRIDRVEKVRTDIYGRKFVDHPDNYEYVYVEQLGVYLDSKQPSRLARMRTTDTNLTSPRDIASDTARDFSQDSGTQATPQETKASGESALVFTPIERRDDELATEKPVEPKETLQSLTSTWSDQQKLLIGNLTERYGAPTEISASAVTWSKKGNYLCIKVMKDSASHHFPAQHQDCLAQTIAFKVPADMADDILAFNGSLVIDRTRGTLTACCDSEELNTLTLNLANDIVNRSRSVEEARSSMKQTALALKNGIQDPYTTKLQFDTDGDSAADPDSTTDSTSANAYPVR